VAATARTAEKRRWRRRSRWPRTRHR